MVINTDSVTRGIEYLDAASKDLKIIVNKLTSARSSSPVSCSYFPTVIDQASGLLSMCNQTINDCTAFNDEVSADDTLIDSILGIDSSEEELVDPYENIKGYDMVVTSDGTLMGEKGNPKTAIMSVTNGYLVKVLSAPEDDQYALVMCYRADGRTGHIGYVDKGCLTPTGKNSDIDFYIEETEFYGKVTKDNVNVRETPGGEHLTQAQIDTYVKVLGFVATPDYSDEQSWYIVSYRNQEGKVQTGFMREDMIKGFDNEENMVTDYKEDTTRAVVTGDNVNIRSGPNTEEDNVLFRLDKNSRVKILDETDEWYYIQYKGKKGYISKQFSTREEKKENPIELNNYGLNENK